MADIELTVDRSTAAERRAVDSVVAESDHPQQRESERLIRGGRVRRQASRHLLLPGLHSLQREIGWITPGGLNYLCDTLQVPPAEAYGVATFYDLLSTVDPGHTESVTHICVDPICRLAGAEELAMSLEDENRRVRRGPCLGQCERAPAQFIQGCGEPDVVPADADSIAAPGSYRLAQGASDDLRLLHRIGVVDPTSLQSYRSAGGYSALRQAIEMSSGAVLDEIESARLSGRGGAAFPTAVKWRAVAEQDGEKHVVANADESEPGTFKDRILMEQDPFAVVESLTIAGLSTGAENGWIYIRGEYPLATARLASAVEQARVAGLLGPDVAGSGQAFDISIRRGAGAYICGEETALFNSIEGFRGEPRNKPPFPTTSGLFGRPTVVNNPETLLNVLDIVENGAADYQSRGTEGSTGHRLFCVSGHVGRPGLYEAPFGIALGELLDLAGGPTGTTRAVLLGGAAGFFVDADQMDLRLSLEDTRAAGVTLGSGVVMVFDNTVDFLDIVTRITAFFRHESCGQCVPCRIGTVRQHEVIVEIGRTGRLESGRRDLLDDIGRAMADASICGLGHTASGAVRSAVELGLLGSE